MLYPPTFGKRYYWNGEDGKGKIVIALNHLPAKHHAPIQGGHLTYPTPDEQLFSVYLEDDPKKAEFIARMLDLEPVDE